MGVHNGGKSESDMDLVSGFSFPFIDHVKTFQSINILGGANNFPLFLDDNMWVILKWISG